MADTELKVPEDMFKDVKFYPVGDLDPQVVQMLKAGKAKEVSYNALATHIIAEDGDNPEVGEAREVFDLPIVKPSWVILSVRCGARLPENGFSPESGQIFFGVTACLSQVSPDDRNALWALITFYGGDCQLSLNKKCSHLIVPEPKGTKYEYAYQRENIKIVAPEWVVDCISEKIRKDEAPYHPRLTYYEEEEDEEEEDEEEENERDSQNASADEDRYSSKSSPASSREGSPLPDQETSPKRSSAAKIKEELMFDDSDDSSPEKQERNLNWTPAEIPQMSTAKRRLPHGKDSGLINLCANVPPVPGSILPPDARSGLLSSVPGTTSSERPDIMAFRSPATRTLRNITNSADIQQITRPSNVAHLSALTALRDEAVNQWQEIQLHQEAKVLSNHLPSQLVKRDFERSIANKKTSDPAVEAGSPSLHVCEASKAWLEGKHATNQLVGKVELLFRPFLLWLDRNLERLYTEGARLLKRDIDVEKAGLEFVPYQQLQAAVTLKSSEKENIEDEAQHENDLQEDVEEDDSDSWISCDEDDDDDLESGTEDATCDGMKTVEGGAAQGPRKGTEIRFLGLKLGAGVGTLTAQVIVVSLDCSRCKVTADLSLTGKQPCTAQCEKCNSRISGAFHQSILHQYSTVLGFVDIQGATPRDLVLLECTFLISCLNCSHEEPVKSLSYGLTKDLNCVQCHSKLSIFIEATRFQKIQRFPGKDIGNKNQGYLRKKAVKDPSIQPGKPLPDRGSCSHYRKSYRWLRFPCCGKAYPCDGCHDEAENHEMELATRMLCGYCAKEQPYSNGKPCVSCGNLMNKNIHSIHWEGGKGCRNRMKMSRKDKQKYANTSKTLSRRSVSKK